jgi:hypothetical protein
MCVCVCLQVNVLMDRCCLQKNTRFLAVGCLHQLSSAQSRPLTIVAKNNKFYLQTPSLLALCYSNKMQSGRLGVYDVQICA